jgi:choline dehydrogenase-like flavoprotein
MTTETRGSAASPASTRRPSDPTFVLSTTGRLQSRTAVVVGSGPAGIACACALAERGLRPLVLDGGRQLEPERAAAIGALDAAELRRSFPVDVDTLPLKPVYGSTYAYAPDEIDADGFGAVPSLAVGGLSAVWGAAMLPFGERDHDGWPFGPEALEPHYRAVLRFVPLAGEDDALAGEHPLYGEPRTLRTTQQVGSLLDDVRRHEARLRDRGAVGGRSRLAVAVDRCDYTGLCLLGCPHAAIWSSAERLRELVRSGLVEHRPGAVVERFEERSGTVRLHLRTKEVLDADVVFVAAGALATTRIVLASLEEYDREVQLLDSAYYTFPALRWRGSRVERGNTLAQVFLEIDACEASSRPVHLQLYGYNDLMLRAAASRLRLSERAASRLLAPLLSRLVFVQGYLHSDESPGARAQLGRDGTLRVRPGEGDAAERVAAVVRKVRSLRRELRLEPITSMLRTWPPGKGFHVGGSFPMRERPNELETDVHGRLAGFERVHLVDASTFPTLPATTITLAAMANAHRIAWASVEF